VTAFDPLDDEFAIALASSKPTPGGGAAAARVGLFASALVRMATAITLERGRPEDLAGESRSRLEDLAARAGAIGADFARLESEDIEAFSSYLAALGLPKATAADRAARRASIVAAARRATDVPIETAATAVSLLELAEELATLGETVRMRAESDIGIALELARGACRAAGWNVRVNLEALGGEREDYERRYAGLAQRAEAVYERTSSRLTRRGS
jgi:formiminotetrahydrofolate cyclodeaminase